MDETCFLWKWHSTNFHTQFSVRPYNMCNSCLDFLAQLFFLYIFSWEFLHQPSQSAAISCAQCIHSSSLPVCADWLIGWLAQGHISRVSWVRHSEFYRMREGCPSLSLSLHFFNAESLFTGYFHQEGQCTDKHYTVHVCGHSCAF